MPTAKRGRISCLMAGNYLPDKDVFGNVIPRPPRSSLGPVVLGGLFAAASIGLAWRDAPGAAVAAAVLGVLAACVARGASAPLLLGATGAAISLRPVFVPFFYQRLDGMVVPHELLRGPPGEFISVGILLMIAAFVVAMLRRRHLGDSSFGHVVTLIPTLGFGGCVFLLATTNSWRWESNFGFRLDD